ncbi:MAG: DegT/DnrJ/EryC1/StrS family aminotransferase [Verrucomicrobia bacterium]|nr:DegT/DnrJ/EryC1/StrS family aminotransferase [Verrucomicrobiota bacterium]
MHVPLLDLKSQYQTIKRDMDAAVAEVFESQYFIGGPTVTACEAAIAAYSNCAHGIGVSSGTDALLVALMTVDIGPGDEVITTPYTFFATGGCISRTGATPVFVDIDPITFNIDCDKIEAAITPRTRAIIPVHLYGQMADMDAVMALATKHDLVVIEDAAQAIGAESDGRRAGSIGHFGCFSFFPSKNLGGAGDGGMVVTNDKPLADKLSQLRNHGANPKYYHALIGGNFRLDALQAAVVNVKLGHLDTWTEARQANAARYDRLFTDAGLAGDQVTLPTVVQSRHIFNQYVIRVEARDALRTHLSNAEIGNEIYYPVPLHLQQCFASLGYQAGSMPHSEAAADHTIAIPVYPEVTDEQAAYVVDTIGGFFA